VSKEILSPSLTQTSEKSSLTDNRSDFISSLPTDLQEQVRQLPGICQRNILLSVLDCYQLADKFPSYPLTSLCLNQMINNLKREKDFLVKDLLSWGERPFYNLWARKRDLLEKEIENSGRRELARQLSERVVNNAQEKFNRPCLSCLSEYFREAGTSFASESLSWAIISDRTGFKRNFFRLFKNIYSLGAKKIEIIEFEKKDLLVAEFPFIEREEITSQYLAADL